MILGEDSKQTYSDRVTHVLHLLETTRKLLETYPQLVDWNHLRRMGECRSEPFNRTTSPEIVEAKQSTTSVPSTHTSQLIIDLLHESSEAVLMEELDSIKKILDPKTPIS